MHIDFFVKAPTNIHVLSEKRKPRLEKRVIAPIYDVLKLRNRNAFNNTEIELNAIAAAANIGLSSGPPNKCKTPAAIGIQIML